MSFSWDPPGALGINTFPAAAPCLAVCTYWLDFGLFKASLWINTTQTINGPSLPWPHSSSVSALRVVWHQAPGKVSPGLTDPSRGVCNIANCHTDLTSVLEHILPDTPDRFRSAFTPEAENCILLVKYQILCHRRGIFGGLFVVFVSH